MGVRDTAEQLEVCREQYERLESKYAQLRTAHENLLRATGMHESLIDRVMEDFS
jgi:phage shock protein A